MIVEVRQGILKEGAEGKPVNLQIIDLVCEPVNSNEKGAMLVIKELGKTHPPSVFVDTAGKIIVRFWHEV